MKNIWWSLVLLAMLPGLASGAYLITLKNGNQLVVDSYREEEGEIRYWLGGGEVGISKDSVESIEPTTRHLETITVSPPSTAPSPQKPAKRRPAATKAQTPVSAGEVVRQDVKPPTVVSTEPKDGDVYWHAPPLYPRPIHITFSEPMDQVATEAAFRTTPPVKGTFAWKGNTMTFTPRHDPVVSGTVTVAVGTGARDLARNALENPYTFSFRFLMLE